MSESSKLDSARPLCFAPFAHYLSQGPVYPLGAVEYLPDVRLNYLGKHADMTDANPPSGLFPLKKEQAFEYRWNTKTLELDYNFFWPGTGVNSPPSATLQDVVSLDCGESEKRTEDNIAGTDVTEDMSNFPSATALTRRQDLIWPHVTNEDSPPWPHWRFRHTLIQQWDLDNPHAGDYKVQTTQFNFFLAWEHDSSERVRCGKYPATLPEDRIYLLSTLQTNVDAPQFAPSGSPEFGWTLAVEQKTDLGFTFPGAVNAAIGSGPGTSNPITLKSYPNVWIDTSATHSYGTEWGADAGDFSAALEITRTAKWVAGDW